MQGPSYDGIPVIQSTNRSAPPAWAVLQRQLMSTMEEGAVALMDKYTERGGAQYYSDCVDDLYEMYYDWGLFYRDGSRRRRARQGARRLERRYPLQR